MSMIRRSRVSSLWIAIAMLGGAAIAGCGTTGHPNRTAANARSGGSSALQFSHCMRANGVPNFPDPGPGGYPAAAQRLGINLSSPAAQSAMNACAHYLPSSGHSPLVPASIRHQELLLAQCMRANGVPNFPDPDANGDIQFPVTSPIPQSPAFQRAQNGPCKKYINNP
jgi:hypothetical protein